MPNFTAFLSYVLITTFTPGPNTIMSMSNASRYGFKKTTVFNLGIFSGFFIVMGLCNIFSYTLYNLIPSIKPFMTTMGAVYILWLAWKTFNSKPNNEIKNEKQTNTFFTGFLFQFINPKLIIYGITTMSTFIVPYYKSPFVLMGFSLFLSIMSFAATSSWALFGSIFQKFIFKNTKLVNSIMAILLVYCAISLFL